MEMAVPPEGSQVLRFETQYARGALAQYRTLLWKNSRVYWRSPGGGVGGARIMRLVSRTIVSGGRSPLALGHNH